MNKISVYLIMFPTSKQIREKYLRKYDSRDYFGNYVNYYITIGLVLYGNKLIQNYWLGNSNENL